MDSISWCQRRSVASCCDCSYDGGATSLSAPRSPRPGTTAPQRRHNGAAIDTAVVVSGAPARDEVTWRVTSSYDVIGGADGSTWQAAAILLPVARRFLLPAPKITVRHAHIHTHTLYSVRLRFGLWVTSSLIASTKLAQRRNRLVFGLVGRRRQTSKPSEYVTSHPGQLSLAILPCRQVQWVPAKTGTYTDTPHDPLAPYLWSRSRSVNKCLANG